MEKIVTGLVLIIVCLLTAVYFIRLRKNKINHNICSDEGCCCGGGCHCHKED